MLGRSAGFGRGRWSSGTVNLRALLLFALLLLTLLFQALLFQTLLLLTLLLLALCGSARGRGRWNRTGNLLGSLLALLLLA